MPFAWNYSGPLQVILPFRRGIMSTRPEEPETPVRQRFSDPDGSPAVLVPERNPKTAEFLGAVFDNVFGKTASDPTETTGDINPYRKFLREGAERTRRSALQSLGTRPKTLTHPPSEEAKQEFFASLTRRAQKRKEALAPTIEAMQKEREERIEAARKRFRIATSRYQKHINALRALEPTTDSLESPKTSTASAAPENSLAWLSEIAKTAMGFRQIKARTEEDIATAAERKEKEALRLRAAKRAEEQAKELAARAASRQAVGPIKTFMAGLRGEPLPERPRGKRKLAPEKGSKLWHTVGRMAGWTGKKFKQAVTPEPVAPEDVAKVLGAQKVKVPGRTEELYVHPREGILLPEQVEKLAPRFRWAQGKFTAPESIAPGAGIKGEILPVWAGLPSFGIARRLAKGRGIRREFASEAEAEAARRPGALAAGAHALGLPLRTASWMLRGLRGIPTEIRRLPERVGRRLLPEESRQPYSWTAREFAPFKGSQEDLKKLIEASKKLPKLREVMEQHLRYIGGTPFISRQAIEQLHPRGEEEAKKIKWRTRPVSFAERIKGSPGLEEVYTRAAQAQKELEAFKAKPKTEQERIRRYQPGLIEQWEHEAKPLTEKGEARVQAIGGLLPRYVRTGTEAQAGKNLWEGMSALERAAAIRAMRIGEVPEGMRRIEPVIPGTKPAIDIEKQLKKFRQAIKKHGKEMGFEPETKAEPEGASKGPKTTGPTIESSSTPGGSAASQSAPQEAAATRPGREIAQAPTGIEGVIADLRTLAQMGGSVAVDPNPISHALRAMAVGVPLSEEAKKTLLEAQVILQKNPNVNMKKFTEGTLKRIKDPNAKAQVQRLFSEWATLAPKGVTVITKGAPAPVSSVVVPAEWAEKAIEKYPFLEGTYLKRSPVRGKYILQDTSEEPQSAGTILSYLRSQQGLEGEDKDFVAQFKGRPGTYAAGMPGAGPEIMMLRPSEEMAAPAGAQGMVPGAGAPQSSQKIMTSSGHTVDTGVLADLFAGDWQSTPQYQQFLQQQIPGYKQPGGFGQAALGTAAMMIPMLFAQRMLGDAMGGMGAYMAGMTLQQPMYDILSNIFGYTSATDPRIVAARRAYLMQLLAQRGLFGRPTGAAETPQTGTQAAPAEGQTSLRT